MDIAKKIQIIREARRKVTPTPVPTPPLKRGELRVGGTIKKEVNPFMKA